MSIKKILLIVAAVAVAAVTVSCTLRINGQKVETIKGTGEILTREYDLAGFDAIRVSGCYDVRFVQTEGEYGVSVETYENIFERLDLKVEGSRLVLGQKGENRFRTDKLNVTVKGPALKAVSVEGSADLDIDRLASGDDLEIEVMGAGDFRLKDISCRAFTVEVNGAGDLNTEGLSCEKATVEVNGAGDVDLAITAAPEVKVCVNGAGDIRMSGQAGMVFCEINGAGSVDVRKLTYESFDSAKSGIGSIKK